MVTCSSLAACSGGSEPPPLSPDQASEQSALGPLLQDRGGSPDERRARVVRSLQGHGVSVAGQPCLRATASVAIGIYLESRGGYVESAESSVSPIIFAASATEMRAAVAHALRTHPCDSGEPFTEAQILSAVSRDDFINTAAQDVFTSANDDTKRIYNWLASSYH